MTNEEIIAAAKEATNNQPIYGRKKFTFSSEELKNFAAIIEKRTIERCAVVAAICSIEEDWTDDSEYYVGMMMGHRNAAAAIRKLGEQ